MNTSDTPIVPQNNQDVSNTDIKASPQIENGFTSFANELLEAMYNIDLSPYETRIVLFVARITYGFKRKTDSISITQFNKGIVKKDGTIIVKGTNISHRNICRVLNRLVSRNIIIKIRNGYISEYGIQKNYLNWLSSDSLASDRVATVCNDTTPVTAEPLPSDRVATGNSDRVATHQINKEIITKNTNTKKSSGDSKNKSVSFEDYKESLRERFNKVDFDTELEKFNLYWSEGNRKLKNPKLALLNWMQKAEQYHSEHGNNGNSGFKGIPGNEPAGAFDGLEKDYKASIAKYMGLDQENKNLIDEVDRR